MARDLQTCFDAFNAQWFRGELPACAVKWATIGKDGASGDYFHYLDENKTPFRHTIRIDKGLKTYPRLAQVILLHECVHLKLHKTKTDHGKGFQNEMKRLARCGAFKDLW